MLHAHSGLRWIVLVLLIVTIINAFKKWKAGEEFVDLDNKLSLVTMIFVHIQLLIGIVLLFVSEKNILENFSMSDPVYRFFAVEHTLGMILAIAAITIGRIQSKKLTTGPLKHKKVFIMFFIGLLLILASIPWPFREILGADWF
ncbi:MAG: hypothetical protein ACPGR5_07965 [Chitinophagales bacterium]